MQDGSISQLAISPDEKLIGFATVKGTVVIVERNSSVTNNRVTQCTEHQGNQITCLLWNSSNNEMFIGDDPGRVSVLHVSLFLVNNFFIKLMVIILNSGGCCSIFFIFFLLIASSIKA